MTIGTSWLDSLSMVSNPKWILMVPLARRNLSNAIEFARAGLKAMSPGSYEAIEIGNEVNLYPGGARPKGYSLNNLVGEWSTYADALQSNLSIPKGPNFWACSFSSTTKWNVQDAWSDGLSKEAAKIKGVSEHYYQTVGSATLEETMLNHTNTTAASHRFQSPASFLRNLKSGSILFILGEVGSALGQGHKNYKLQDSLGSAIWTADWMLYAMSIGVSRVNMQLISEGTISAWLPIVNKVGGTQQPAQVLGNWYGNVMIADILGSGKGKKIQVAEMNNLSGADMAGYSIYHDGTLTQIALFNEHLWVKGDGKRPEQNVALSGLGGCDKLKVQRLTGDSGTALKNISWAGQRWSAERKGVPQKVGQESTIVESKNGCFDITVQATEGVLISLL